MNTPVEGLNLPSSQDAGTALEPRMEKTSGAKALGFAVVVSV